VNHFHHSTCYKVHNTACQKLGPVAYWSPYSNVGEPSPPVPMVVEPMVIMYTGKVVISRNTETTGHKQEVTVVFDLSNSSNYNDLECLETHSPIASLFKCDISYLWRVARSLCICTASFSSEIKNVSNIRKTMTALEEYIRSCPSCRIYKCADPVPCKCSAIYR